MNQKNKIRDFLPRISYFIGKILVSSFCFKQNPQILNPQVTLLLGIAEEDGSRRRYSFSVEELLWLSGDKFAMQDMRCDSSILYMYLYNICLYGHVYTYNIYIYLSLYIYIYTRIVYSIYLNALTYYRY